LEGVSEKLLNLALLACKPSFHMKFKKIKVAPNIFRNSFGVGLSFFAIFKTFQIINIL
jgi:hypothetical protein